VNPGKNRNLLFRAVLIVGAAAGALTPWRGAPVFPFGIAGYLIVSLVPGAALYRLFAKRPGGVEEIAAAVALSPVITTTVVTLAMLAGLPGRAAVILVLVFAALLGFFAVPGAPRGPRMLAPREALSLTLVILAVAAAISYLPFTREWWRVRSDAWFHGAVIAQIADFGIPPEDPYTAGLPLQYMWFYHVFAYALSKVSGIGPFWVMSLINIHAVVGFALGAFLFSSVFGKTYAHNLAATVTVLFGMNAAVWVFLPLKALRAFTGEVRGMAEIHRIFALHPFDVSSVRRLVQVGFVQEFLLDKFMVATAFSLGLCLMAVLWWSAARYLDGAKREYLALGFFAAFGMVAFHTALGAVAFAGIAGGLILLLALRRRIHVQDTRPVVRFLLAMVVCGICLLPYIYSVTHAKTGDKAIPLGFSLSKMLGIFVSSALVIFLAAFQTRRVLAARDPVHRFLVWSTAAVVAVCAAINLPAANSYDKLPFVFFFPVAVVGGWTIADYAARAATAARRNLRFVIACLLAFGPLNIFMFAGYYHTTPFHPMSDDEKKVGRWIHSATPRESIIIDSNLDCFLLVAGPRRYYLASEGYAEIWGYDPSLIAARKRVKDNVLGPYPLERNTLETLGAMKVPVYVIARKDDSAVDWEKLELYPLLFHRVFSAGPILVFEVDRAACRAESAAPEQSG
jgi:hypothetical protein